jgi:DNA-binding transcriptional LysR family regulator
MDLAALEIFCAVAREGSVTRAAERLGRAQSNVSTRLQQLQEQLGAELLERDGRGVRLTAAGATLLAYAERLLALAEEARQALHPQEPAGRLRLGAMESTAAARLPIPLARLHARWPALRLELRTGSSRRLAEQVLACELDCALIAWPPPGWDADLDSGLQRHPVYEEALLLALPASHPPAAGAADLRLHRLAAFDRGCSYRAAAERWMGQGGARVEVLELASYPAMLACVAAGHCAAVLPRSMLALLQPPPTLRWVELGASSTVLVARAGYATAALQALRQELLAQPGAVA